MRGSMAETERQTVASRDAPLPFGIRFGNSRGHLSIKCSVNKAVKNGVVAVRVASVDCLRQWYRLYLENMREAFVPARPYRFFEALQKNLEACGAFELWSAQLAESGEMIAGIIILKYGKSAIFGFAGAKRNELWRNPYDLLHWCAMHEAWKEGYKWYDFGEVSESDEGLIHYKKKWGTTETYSFRCYYSGDPVSDGEIFSPSLHYGKNVVEALWQKMPLSFTASIGEYLYRYL
jgi:hypothetical protein